MGRQQGSLAEQRGDAQIMKVCGLVAQLHCSVNIANNEVLIDT